MLNRVTNANDPFEGLDLPQRPKANGLNQNPVATWLRQRVEQWRCARLRRDQANALAKLDDRTLADIGWPDIHEARDPCAKT